jgi:hypothetical protein
MFGEDQRSATAIELKAWQNRPLSEKLKEMFAVIWQSLL